MTKVPDHVGFVPQQSTDKIGDLSIDNRRFCLQVYTKVGRNSSKFQKKFELFLEKEFELFFEKV